MDAAWLRRHDLPVRLLAALALVLLLAGCGSSAKHVLLPRPEGAGRWTRLLLSPDGKTYLGQWSGGCEIQTAYLIPVHSVDARPLTNYRRGSAQSVAVGWAGAKARVRLPQGQPPARKSGIYLVDPQTLAMTLEKPLRRRPGC